MIFTLVVVEIMIGRKEMVAELTKTAQTAIAYLFLVFLSL